MKKKRQAPPAPVVEQPKKAGFQFSLADARTMLAIARSAPMPNADEAEARLVLFQKYQQFMAVLFKQVGAPVEPPPPPPVQTAEKPVTEGVKKALRKRS